MKLMENFVTLIIIKNKYLIQVCTITYIDVIILMKSITTPIYMHEIHLSICVMQGKNLYKLLKTLIGLTISLRTCSRVTHKKILKNTTLIIIVFFLRIK